MTLLAFDPDALDALQSACGDALDGLGHLRCADPAAAEASLVLDRCRTRLSEVWMPIIGAVRSSRALLDGIESRRIDGLGDVPWFAGAAGAWHVADDPIEASEGLCLVGGALYDLDYDQHGGLTVRWSPEGRHALIALLGERQTAGALGVRGHTHIGDLPEPWQGWAYAAWLTFMEHTMSGFDVTTFRMEGYEPEVFSIQDLPLAYLIAEADPRLLDVDSAAAAVAALPPSPPDVLEPPVHPYDPWSGSGRMIQADTAVVDAALGAFATPRPGDEFAFAAENLNSLFDLLGEEPLSGVAGIVGGLGIGLVVDGFMMAAARPIDPDVAMYPDNYWMELSGLPQWPPMGRP